MFLQRFIKQALVGALFLFAGHLFGQSDTVVRVSVPSPYKTEYNPWYKLTTFKRGFHSDSLTDVLDKLEEKPRKDWTRIDSLKFASTSLHTGNIDLSEYYFDHLTIKYTSEESFWWDQIMIFILKENFDAAIESIHKSSPGILQNSRVYFLDKILLAYIAEKKDPKWYKTGRVLNWEIDSTLFSVDKKSEQFNTEIIEPLKNLDFVLKEMIHFIHDDDPVLAKTCFEMGLIFENHISYTQAYISYSLGRNYNKGDKEILNNVKEVKGKLSEKKYKIPNFRKYFPTIEHWRFDYEVLKEKIIFEKQDTIAKQKPILMLKKEETKLPFPYELIIVVGIFVLFILVYFFLKTKK